MSTPSHADTLKSAAPKIALAQALSNPQLRESIVLRALAQLSGDQSEAAGIVVASAPQDKDGVAAIGKRVWAAAGQAPADYPFDMKLDSDESRAKFREGVERLNQALMSADGDWEGKRQALFNGLGSEIARRAGKTLAAPAVAQAVAAGQAASPEALGPDEIVVFEMSHAAPAGFGGGRPIPDQIVIGVMDRQTLAAAASHAAETSATVDVASKLRARQAESVRASSSPKAPG